MTKKQRKTLVRIIFAAVIMIGLQFVPRDFFNRADSFTFESCGRYLRLGAYLINYLIIGHDILKKAFKGIKNRQVFDENFLMAVATIGAMALAIYENGDYLEAIAVMLFYQVGEWFQSYAVGKSRRSIGELMDIRPDRARVLREGTEDIIDPDEVEIGSMIVVNPGEKVPIDGIVEEGRSYVDTRALTGESVPREIEEGGEIFSGCINMTGVLKIRTVKEFGESTASKILDLVENASSRKTKQEDFISRFARVYTPAVCYSALALAILPPAIGMLSGFVGEWGIWLYRALTFLVISCPCALVISIPLSFFAGLGGASREGILVKGSNYLEALSKTGYVVLDKTGTLTKGVFEVSLIKNVGISKESLLEYAALAESASSHPISKSLRRAYAKDPDSGKVRDISEISGYGVTATVDSKSVAVGNDKLMRKLGIDAPVAEGCGTVVHVAVDRRYAGYIVISDAVKPSAREALVRLKKAGVKKAIMLTGDSVRAAEAIAKELGTDEVYAELLPAGKVEKMEEIIRKKDKGRNVLFAGDGINDAPVLSRADIGVAMGAMGADAAIEAADVVLMDDDPVKIAKAIRIAKKCMRIVYQNIIFAIGIKLCCLALGALGMANMWFAIFADVGVMILAVLNAMRALQA